MKPWAGLKACGRMAVGGLLLLAAGLKVSSPPRGIDDPGGVWSFAAAIEAQGLMPAAWAGAAAWTVIGLEIAVGVWLLSHRGVRAASAAALALLAVFAAYLGLVKAFGRSHACGCFGSVGDGDIGTALVRTALMATALSPSVLTRRGSRGAVGARHRRG